MQKLILKAKPNYDKPPTNKILLKCWMIINSFYFEATIMLCIVFNILTMAMSYETASDQYNSTLEYINLFFTAVFIFEAAFKISVFSFSIYIKSGWNCFDLFVVIVSIFDIIMDYLGNNLMKFVKVGPQLARIFRVLRVTRLFKLVKSLKGLQDIIETTIYTLPSLLNVASLLFLIFYIFSVLGVFLFQDIREGQIIDDDLVNFKNFHQAFLLLFRFTTGEDWYTIMFDFLKDDKCTPVLSCSKGYYSFYFLGFIIMCQFIMLTLFILVILTEFQKNYIDPNNPLKHFKFDQETFKEHWAKQQIFNDGFSMNPKTLLDFYLNLPEPLGKNLKEKLARLEENNETDEKKCQLILQQKQNAAKEIMEMNITTDQFGNIYFNLLFYCIMKNAFKKAIFSQMNTESYKLLSRLDKKVRAILKSRSNKVKKNQILSSCEQSEANPIVLLFWRQIIFKTWKSFAIISNTGQSFDRDYSKESEEDKEEDEEEEDNSSGMGSNSQKDDNDDDDNNDDYDSGDDESMSYEEASSQKSNNIQQQNKHSNHLNESLVRKALRVQSNQIDNTQTILERQVEKYKNNIDTILVPQNEQEKQIIDSLSALCNPQHHYSEENLNDILKYYKSH